MTFAVLALAVFVVGNVVLTLALIRRTLNLEAAISNMRQPAGLQLAAPPGTHVGEFTLRRWNNELPPGEEPRAELAQHVFDSSRFGPLKLAVFSPDCSSCTTAAKTLATTITTDPARDEWQTLVVSRTPEEVEEFISVAGLDGSQVLWAASDEASREVIQDILQVKGFPVFLKLDETRTVRKVSSDLQSFLNHN